MASPDYADERVLTPANLLRIVTGGFVYDYGRQSTSICKDWKIDGEPMIIRPAKRTGMERYEDGGEKR